MFKKSLMFAAVLCTMAMSMGCEKNSSEESTNLGSAKMAISMGDYDVTMVDWVITDSSDTTIREGSIEVVDPMAKISTMIGGLPSGDNYKISLSAVIESDDNEVGTCSQSAVFSITAGQTTVLELTLNCILDEKNGDLNVNANGNICPTIDYVTASPLVQVFGESIVINAEASDANDDDITILWTADKGTFSTDNELNTAYTCTSNGTVDITLSVTDNVSASNDTVNCNTQKTVNVECVSKAVCGNSIKEEGEDCDDGNTVSNDGCDATCTLEVCGDDIVQSGIGEECDPPDGTSCNDECKLMGCGNGTIEAGEECDDSNDVACDGCYMCKLEYCGNGVQECDEQCDDGNQVSGDGCENDCTETIDICDQCSSEHCVDYGGDDVYTACYEGSTAPACKALMQCAHDTKCPVKDSEGNAWNAPHPSKCYCGSASTMACMTGSANGPCIAEVEAAAESTDPMVIGERFANPAYAVGDAMGLLLCEMDHCGEGICL